MQDAHGLFIVYSGNGKGKTTAALGLAVRAIGHGKPVRFIQFIKGNRKTGEYRFMTSLGGVVDFHTLGRGFVRRSDDREEDRRAARDAWEFASKTISEGAHELVVLDEITYPMKYGFLCESEVLDVILARPGNVHVVVTGREAPETFVDKADLVTQMCSRKHPFERGIKAQIGIEF